ncbi:hypothetical protein ACM9HF_18740 [Colwellia sp. RE-S-Sl-9]
MNIPFKSSLITGIFVMSTQLSHAALITPDITISGFAEFDTTSLPFSGTGSQSGEIKSVLGGTTSTTIITDVTPAGANPQGGLFSMTGDGVGASAVAMGDAFDFMGDFFFSFNFDLANSSGVDDYMISFGIDFSNTVDADGADAYVDSEIVLEDTAGELFFSDVTSDTLGDEKNGIALPTSGAAISDSGLFDFDVTLLAGGMYSFDGFLKMDGEEFDGGTFSADSTAFIYIKEITKLGAPVSVPIPATILLFLTGSLGLLVRKYFTKK